MNECRRIKLTVYIDLDPIPGAMHTAESARNIVETRLQQIMPHHYSGVLIESYDVHGDALRAQRAVEISKETSS